MKDNDDDETANCCTVLIENNCKKNDLDLWKIFGSKLGRKNYDEKLEEARTDECGTLLHLAVESEDTKHLKLCLEDERFKNLINTPDKNGRTPLHTAVISEKKKALDVLLEQEADPNARDILGKAPLHHLAEKFNSKCALELQEVLLEYGADSNALDKNEKAPLHHLAEKFNSKCALELLEVLLEYGADSNALDKNEKAPLYYLEDTFKTNWESVAAKVQINSKRASMYNLLMQHNYKDLHENLCEGEVDFYVGKKKLICFVLSDTKGELQDRVKVVNRLLEIGVDPLSCDSRGYESAVELALGLALEEEQPDLVEAMIDKLKEKKTKYDNISFDLLRRVFMMAGNKKNQQEGESEVLKWLERLFKFGAIQNVNQTNPRLSSKQSALGRALSYDYKRAVLFLLNHGASLNSVSEDLTYQRLTELLNMTITFETGDENETKNTREKSAIINYGCLIQNASKDETEDTNETDTLMAICHNKQFEHVLFHPTVWALIMAKWSKLRKGNMVYSLLSTVWHLVFIGSFTALVWPTSTDKPGSFEIKDERHILRSVVSTLCSLNIMVDMVKLFLSFKLKWLLRSKWIVIPLILISMVIKVIIISICFWKRCRSVIAWVAPAACLYSAIRVGGNWESLNIFPTMLGKITWYIGKLSILTLFLVVGFSLSFSILIWPNHNTNNCTSLADFSSPWTAFPRVVAMATGEFSYDSLRDGMLVEDHTLTSEFNILLFLVFVCLVFLVIMNAMTGVAMVEAQEIKNSAALNYLKRQLELAYVVDQLTKCIPKLGHFFKIWKTEQLPLKGPVLRFPLVGKFIQISSSESKVETKTIQLSNDQAKELSESKVETKTIQLSNDQAKELRLKLLALREEKTARKKKKAAKREKEELRRNVEKLLSLSVKKEESV